MATTIMVVSKAKAGTPRGDWAIKKGSGRGGTYKKRSDGEIKGYHDKKNAIRDARQWARGVRQRTGNAVQVKVQSADDGSWHHVHTYRP